MARINSKDLAQLEYHGNHGVTADCLNAVARLIHFGEKIEKAWLLSRLNNGFGTHALLLTMEYGDQIVIQAGFTSGYGGEGPAGLSTVLRLLREHNVPIEEYDISAVMFERLTQGALLNADLEWLEQERFVRPVRYYDYIFDKKYWNDLQEYFPPSINFGLLDPRLMDVALNFFDNPGHAIDTAYKRLEDTLRKRTALPGESGTKLLTKAFVGDESHLHWNDENTNEHNSKANLFKAVFGAYRNPRAHREIASDDKAALREFMLINELYLLEAKAIERQMTTLV